MGRKPLVVVTGHRDDHGFEPAPFSPMYPLDPPRGGGRQAQPPVPGVGYQKLALANLLPRLHMNPGAQARIVSPKDGDLGPPAHFQDIGIRRAAYREVQAFLEIVRTHGCADTVRKPVLEHSR